MNQSLMTYLGNLGHTGSLDDRIHQYLVATVVGATGSESSNDLWIRLGAQLGFTATTVQEIQMLWCAAAPQNSTGTTWNELMRNLAP